MQRPGRGGRVAASWRPIGPEESVAMDRQNPYVGVHTPLIRLAGDAPRGIQQAGLVLGKGKTYTGRVVLAGMPGSKVTVSLVWGDGTGGRQVLPITSLGASYSKVSAQVHCWGRYQGWTDRDLRDRPGFLPYWGGLAHASGQYPRLPPRCHRPAEGAALRNVALAGRQLSLGVRMARCDRRSRQAGAEARPCALRISAQ